MAATTDQLDMILDLRKKDLIPRRTVVADIGCQQLYGATLERVDAFMQGVFPGKCNAEKYVQNGTFIGDILIDVGFEYRSFDIIEAPHCEYLNLNADAVPPHFLERADLTLNFGTTEHVLNQYNALKILHDFTKPGGLIYSLFLRGGNMEHGLLHYSDRFVNLWCRANQYEQVWRSDHNAPGNECTWIIVRRTSDEPFKDIIDVQDELVGLIVSNP